MQVKSDCGSFLRHSGKCDCTHTSNILNAVRGVRRERSVQETASH